MSNVWLIENQKSTNKQKPKPANKTKTQTKKKQTKRNKFKLLLQQQYSVPLRMSVHRQWAKRDLGLSLSLIARNPISTNRGFTAYKPCTNLDLRKSCQEQLRCERRRITGNISEKYFVQQMKPIISAHRLNRSKPVIGPKNSRLPLDQSAVHRKLIMVWSPAFSRAFNSYPVFNLSSHENTHSVPYLLAIVVILVSVFWYIFSL